MGDDGVDAGQDGEEQQAQGRMLVIGSELGEGAATGRRCQPGGSRAGKGATHR